MRTLGPIHCKRLGKAGQVRGPAGGMFKSSRDGADHGQIREYARFGTFQLCEALVRAIPLIRSMYEVVPARGRLQLHFFKSLRKDMHDRGPNGTLQGKPPGFPCPIRASLSLLL